MNNYLAENQEYVQRLSKALDVTRSEMLRLDKHYDEARNRTDRLYAILVAQIGEIRAHQLELKAIRDEEAEQTRDAGYSEQVEQLDRREY